MTDFLASRCMEDFFVNPTMAVDTSAASISPTSMMGESSIKIELDGCDTDDKDARLSRPLSYFQDFMTDHRFTSGYCSEEEAASPSDSTESLSVKSVGNIDLNIDIDIVAVEPEAKRISLIPEELAESCAQIEQRWNRAQAVVLRQAGKPKVVSMPKVIDSPVPRRSKRASVENYRAILASTRILRRSNTASSLRPSGPSPLKESSPPAELEIRSPAASEATGRKPSVPLLRAASKFDAFPRLSDIAALASLPQTPGVSKRSFQASPTVPESETFGSGQSTSNTISAKRRLHRFTSMLSLHSMSDKGRRKPSIPALPRVSVTEPSPRSSFAVEAILPRPPMLPVPQRISSVGKLVPRGANERAPILILPPCPDELDDDFPTPPLTSLPISSRPRPRQPAKIRRKQHPTIASVVASGAHPGTRIM